MVSRHLQVLPFLRLEPRLCEAANHEAKATLTDLRDFLVQLLAINVEVHMEYTDCKESSRPPHGILLGSRKLRNWQLAKSTTIWEAQIKKLLELTSPAPPGPWHSAGSIAALQKNTCESLSAGPSKNFALALHLYVLFSLQLSMEISGMVAVR